MAVISRAFVVGFGLHQVQPASDDAHHWKLLMPLKSALLNLFGTLALRPGDLVKCRRSNIRQDG
jgi:hypothetical protein